jgi:chromate transporter
MSAIYVGLGDTTLVSALFAGLAPAVLAIVTQAVIRVAGRALRHRALIALAVGAFIALAVFAVPFPIVVLVAALIGWGIGRVRPHIMAKPDTRNPQADGPAPVISDDALHHARPTLRRAGIILVIGLPLWLGPVAVAFAVTGADSVYTQQALFFSGTALVTFGGAYAVLAYVAQKAVETYGWLNAGEMVRGLALAETTPGPLIMVVQFVAFLGAFRDPGTLDPWVAATIASLLTTWVTFVPCFLFIFVGAPYVESLRGNKSLSAALTGITAAVVGVIANLAIYFAVHTLFAESRQYDAGPLHLDLPVLSTLQPVALAIGVVAMVLTFKLKWSVLRILGICALLGLAAGLLIQAA